MKGGHASGQTGAWREIELDGIMAEQMNSVREQTHTDTHTQTLSASWTRHTIVGNQACVNQAPP